MGRLRITSGTLRGRTIAAPPGEGTRPLLTRVRKSLLDLLRPRLAGARVLDLFGGSGAIAFELVSNGAAEAVIIELDPLAARVVAANAVALGVSSRMHVRRGDALALIPALGEATETFDLVIAAPPYGLALQRHALNAVGEAGIVVPGGLVVVQRDRREPETPAPKGLEATRVKGYGRTVFEFFEPSPTLGPSTVEDDKDMIDI